MTFCSFIFSTLISDAQGGNVASKACLPAKNSEHPAPGTVWCALENHIWSSYNYFKSLVRTIVFWHNIFKTGKGTKCWTGGWGRMQNKKLPDILQEVDLPLISDDVCRTTRNAPMLEVWIFLISYFLFRSTKCRTSGGNVLCRIPRGW